MRWNHCPKISMSSTIKPVGKGKIMMTFEEWHEKYKPIKNHLARGEDRDYFETYDLELGYVLGIADTQPKRVWTYVDGDGGTYVVDGYHLVNRIYYFITEVPFEGSGLEVIVDQYEEYDHEL